MAIVVASIALAALLSAGGTAVAQPTPRQRSQARAHYQEGMKLFNLGRFPDSVKEFERAYELDSAPVHLFNIAQAHWKAGDHSQAKFFYKRYIVELPDGEKRKAAEDRIAEIDRIMATRAPPAPRSENAEPRASSVQPDPAPEEGSASGSSYPHSARDARHPVDGEGDQPAGKRTRLRPWAIASGAVGVVAIGAGIAASLKVRSDSERVERAPVFDPSAQESGRRLETLQYIAVHCIRCGGRRASDQRGALDPGCPSRAVRAPISVDGTGARTAGG